MEEGCLSIPGAVGTVSRKNAITVEYYNEDWIYNKEDFRGIKARVIQHEYDHLEGEMWVDKTVTQPTLQIMSVLQACQTKTAKTEYPTL